MPFHLSALSAAAGPSRRAGWFALAGFCAALSWACPAGAARPLATDDAGVLDGGACEIEAYGSRLNLRGAGRETTASAQLSCGVGAGAQIAGGYGLGTSSDAQNGDRHEALAAGAKLRVFGREDAVAFALSAGSVMGRTGSGPFQFDSLYAVGVLTGELTERITGHVNVGSAHSRTSHLNSTTWNLALEFAVQPGLDLGAEWYGDDRSPGWMGFGLRYAASEKVIFGTSYAVQSASFRQRLVSLGVTFGF